MPSACRRACAAGTSLWRIGDGGLWRAWSFLRTALTFVPLAWILGVEAPRVCGSVSANMGPGPLSLPLQL